MTIWHLFDGLHQGVKNVQRLHRIPCSRCRYATDNHYLKCSVHPFAAFSEDAISCADFEANPPEGYQEGYVEPSATAHKGIMLD